MKTKTTATTTLWQLKTRRLLQAAAGSIKGNRVDAYWSIPPNFGDQITPLLLRHYGFTPVYSLHPEHARVIATGSLLQWIPEDYDGVILGSGLIHDERRTFPHARILAVRGPLTADRISAPKDVVLGDPGLLARRVLGTRPPVTHAIGLIPHYMDQKHPAVQRLIQRFAKEIIVIDVRRKPLDVFRRIASCEIILSSSLHGIITADACGIKSAWLELSDQVLGQGFKFRDYFAAIGARQDPYRLTGDEAPDDLRRLTRSVPDAVQERADELHHLFASLKKTLDELKANQRRPR